MSRPIEGGSYIRGEDGELKRVEFTLPADAPAPDGSEAAAPGAPAEPKIPHGPARTAKKDR